MIQVPAYFDEEQKEATMTAGKIAGLQTVRLLRQSSACCLSSTALHLFLLALMCSCNFSLLPISATLGLDCILLDCRQCSQYVTMVMGSMPASI